MTSTSAAESDRVAEWKSLWQQGETSFHREDVHPILVKYIDKLNPNGKLEKILVPLCGKTLDLKWLAAQGIVTVGVEGVQQALEEFFTEAGLERTETSVAQLGPLGKLLTSKDGMQRLYCGDVMQFSSTIEGKFDAIWDRAALVALDREDVPRYAQILVDLLNPGGRLLVEVLQYDLNDVKDLEPPFKPPPPYPMYEDEIRRLFEPQCTVEQIEVVPSKYLGYIDRPLYYYFIVKK